jgi:hypothetical protein
MTMSIEYLQDAARLNYPRTKKYYVTWQSMYQATKKVMQDIDDQIPELV